jgi:hypothetical protein
MRYLLITFAGVVNLRYTIADSFSQSTKGHWSGVRADWPLSPPPNTSVAPAFATLILVPRPALVRLMVLVLLGR